MLGAISDHDPYTRWQLHYLENVYTVLAITHTLYAKNPVFLTLVSLTWIVQTKSSATTIWFQLFAPAPSFQHWLPVTIKLLSQFLVAQFDATAEQ